MNFNWFHAPYLQFRLKHLISMQLHCFFTYTVYRLGHKCNPMLFFANISTEDNYLKLILYKLKGY